MLEFHVLGVGFVFVFTWTVVFPLKFWIHNIVTLDYFAEKVSFGTSERY